MKSKTILMLNDHIHFGGGGDAVFQLERQIFEQAGHQVYTYSMSPDAQVKPSAHDIIFQEPASYLQRRLGKFVIMPKLVQHLRDVLHRLQPDFIKLHLLAKYPAEIYAALKGYKAVQILHGPNLFCATGWGALKINSNRCEQGIGRKCYQRGCVNLAQLPLHMNLDRRIKHNIHDVVTKFLAPSHQIAQTAHDLGYRPVEYFPLTIDPVFEDIEPRYDDRANILFVGALVEAKGLAYLIEALPAIVRALPKLSLNIAGRGALTSSLKQKVTQLELQARVNFLGFQSRAELLQLYQQASVVVMPSIWCEQFGLVGLEALAAGVPVVATDIGGIPEWCQHEKHGLLVPARDSGQIASAVIRLLRDITLRRHYGAAGREFVLAEFAYQQYQQNILAQLD